MPCTSGEICKTQHKWKSWKVSRNIPNGKYVVIANGESSAEQVMSGVPQGTVLTPAFFIIIISEIDGKVNEYIVRRFVDDTRISKKIGNRKLF